MSDGGASLTNRARGIWGDLTASTFAPLAHPVFAAFWFSTLISNFGGQIQNVGASWLMRSIAPSPDMVALVQTATTAPIMLFSVFAGALADTRDRRAVMLAGQAIMMSCAVALAALTLLGMVSPVTLLALTFGLGAGAALQMPAWQAAVADMIPAEALPAAVAMNSLGFNTARSLGPALGGALVAAFGAAAVTQGAAAAFVANALSYVGVLIVLLRWRAPPAQLGLPRETLWEAVGSGLRYVLLSPRLLAVLARAGAFGFCAAGFWGLITLVAADILHGDAGTLGLLWGGFGIGALCGGFLSARARALLNSNKLVNVVSLLFAAATAVCAFSPHLWLSLAAAAACGLGWMLALTTFNIVTQITAPRWVVGRALSLYQLAVFAGLSIGAAWWGYFAKHSSVPLAMLAASAAMAASVLAALRLRLPEAEPMELTPWPAPAMTQPTMPIEPRSGPVELRIEYRVAPALAEDFMEAARAVGRIRRRDGARRWRLAQDIDDPTTWVESFQSPTWVEFQRRRARPTVADVAALKRLRAYQTEKTTPFRRLLERPPGAAPIGSASGPSPTASEPHLPH